MQNTIDIHDDTQLQVWARRFGIPPDHLAQLVSQLGPSLARIRDALKHEEISRSGGRRLSGR
jgi:hypothetical protein